MKPPRILVPIDLSNVAPEVFQVINDLARNSCPVVVLLHVIHLNILAPDSRIYDELGREASWHLNRLSGFVDSNASIQIRVRFGRVAQEILAEAKADTTDLILLSSRLRSSNNRAWRFPWSSRAKPLFSSLAETLTSSAGWQVLLVPVKTTYDCELVWTSPTLARQEVVDGHDQKDLERVVEV